jgi:glycosyltransferase involved in cell wall biosynthesis
MDLKTELTRIRKELSECIDALYVGRINETKGLFDAVKVVDIVRRDYPCFQFAIMGDGDERTKARLKKEINRLGLYDNVKFLGTKSGEEKFKIIRQSMTFLFLSYRESFGLALMEAVCCGLPAFVYDVPEYKKIYMNNEVIVSPLGDYRVVAEKMISVFKRREFGNKPGELLLEKQKTWEQIAEMESKAVGGKNV